MEEIGLPWERKELGLGKERGGARGKSFDHLADKIMKTEWDIADGGAQVIISAEGAEDLIPTNQWLKRVVLRDRVEYMRIPLGAGTRPMTDIEEGAHEPIRFYVQTRD
ncbi:Protein transport protein Sec31A [Hordeum vulgare]|nr:Protein transport protein Sec31A [Hordeum vulgare]